MLQFGLLSFYLGNIPAKYLNALFNFHGAQDFDTEQSGQPEHKQLNSSLKKLEASCVQTRCIRSPLQMG